MGPCPFQSVAVILLCSIHSIEGSFQGPSNTDVVPGSNVTLRCRLNDEPNNPGVKWSYIDSEDVNKGDVTIGTKNQNGAFLQTDDPRYSFVETSDVSVFDLQINFAQLSDSGKYTCRSGTQFTKTATLDVVYYGAPKFLARPVDRVVAGGSTVRLSCQAIGTEDVRWIFVNDTFQITLTQSRLGKLSEILYNSDRISFPLGNAWNYHYDIQISSVRQSDSGVYTCLVKGTPLLGNIQATAQAKLEVSVCDVKNLTVKPQNKIVNVGDRVTFHCKPQDNLPELFQVYWVRFSPTETSANSVRITSINGTWKTEVSNINYDGFDIIINNVAKSDWGFYTCALALKTSQCPYNDVPTSATAKLSVKTKPKMEIVSSPEDMKPKYVDFAPPVSSRMITKKYFVGDNVKLPCNIITTDDQSYGRKVFWFDKNLNLLFDGARRITTDKRMSVSRNENKQWHLFIKRITWTDIGNYYCLTDLQPAIWQQVMLNAHGCPTTKLGNWQQFDALGKCYSPPSFATSFGAAEVWCRKTAGGYLAMPKTPDEINAVVKVMEDSNFASSDVWIGLDNWKRGLFIWNDGSDLRKDQEKWESKILAGNTCGALNTGTKKFKYQMCNVTLLFICEVADDSWQVSLVDQRTRCPDGWVFFQCGGFCYWAAPEPMTRSFARLKCEAEGGSLVELDPEDRLNFIRLIRPADGIGFSEAWLSLKRQTNIYSGDLRLWFDDSWGKIVMYDERTTQAIDDKVKPENDQDCLVFTYSNPEISPRRCNIKRMCVCKRNQFMSMNSADNVCGKALPLEHYHIFRKKRDNRRQIMTNFEDATKDEHRSIKDATRWNEIKNHRYKHDRHANLSLHLGKLMGGKATGIESFPWFVQLYSYDGQYRHLCSGAIIEGRWVVTAARCLYDDKGGRKDASVLRVVRGTGNKSPWSGLMSMVAETYTYNYNFLYDRGKNNIALIKLSIFIRTDCPRIGEICLDPIGHIDLQESDCYYAGMGEASDDVLTYCGIDSFKQKPNEKVYRIDWNRCSVKAGDTGAPMMCRQKKPGASWYLFGVVSQRVDHDGGSIEFTKVSAYLGFMMTTMGGNSTSKKKSGNVKLCPSVTSLMLTSLVVMYQLTYPTTA